MKQLNTADISLVMMVEVVQYDISSRYSVIKSKP